MSIGAFLKLSLRNVKREAENIAGTLRNCLVDVKYRRGEKMLEYFSGKVRAITIIL